jgi:hypothetical protein
LRSWSFALGFAAAVLVTASLLADRVVLTSGEVLDGKVVRLHDREVSIRLHSGGVLSFRASQLRLVRLEHKNGTFSTRIYQKDERSAAPSGPPEPPPAAGSGAPSARKAGPPRDLVSLPPPAAGAREAPSPRPPPQAAPPPPELLAVTAAGAITDDQRRFRVVPPPGLLKAPPSPGEPEVVHSYHDPFTHTTFTVAAYSSGDPLVEIKRKVASSYSNQFNSFRVIREKQLEGTPYEGWLVEVKSELGDVAMHQMQLFARSGPDVLILTYSAAEEQWPRYHDSFQQSMDSFALLDESEVKDLLDRRE